ncbi:hypothetical protein Pla123a_20420 [Posidoniimonas polymericola]|uniref:DUF1559 domain-containing protein n=1 Tax=Posidoniimonas polymericola TaxID=2528002 RepID=A0A5C5YR16_9BACT|nr:hypothetical protein Pla123a_20420 [Posidoniimonas polymericola]
MLRLVLAWSVLIYPYSAVRAQAPPDEANDRQPQAGAIDPAYLTPQTMAAASLRPQQVLTDPNLQMLPIEVAQAAGLKYLGIDPTHASRVTVVVEPPAGPTPFYAIAFETDQPVDLGALAAELTEHTEPGQIDGHDAIVSRAPALPCFLVQGGNTLLVGSAPMLKKLLKADRPKPTGVLPDQILAHPATDDLYLTANLEMLRPFIQMGLAAAQRETPEEFQDLLRIPTLIQSAELTLNLNLQRPSSLLVHAANASDAEQIESLTLDGVALLREQIRRKSEVELSRLRQSDDPVERAMAAYSDRMSQGTLDGIKLDRDGNTLTVFEATPSNAQQLGSVAVIGVLVALLLPAVQAAREAARRTQSTNNLKQLMLALLNYESANGRLPAHAIYSADGEPLLSWRVAILPYIEEQALYNEFHLDEPWDSEHNLTLIEKMPEVYIDPSSGLAVKDGKTSYLAPVGEGLLFEEKEGGTTLREITDGTSKTIAIVQVSDDTAATWTKPEDWSPAADNPLQGVGDLHPSVFLAAFVDGHIENISTNINAQTWGFMLTRGGGEAW